MANRNFNRKQVLEKEIKEIYLKVAIGASGAPTLVARANVGVTSISRSSAGVYVITLQDKYMRLMHSSVRIMAPVAENLTTQVVSENVAVAKTITFRCVNGTVATDPASGDNFLIALQLKNSSVR